VDTSNLKDVYYAPDELKQGQLDMFTDHIKPDRRPEDLLFQVFLDWGLDLALPIAKETIDGKTVFFVDSNALLACFDKGINEELVKKLAKRQPLERFSVMTPLPMTASKSILSRFSNCSHPIPR